MKEYQLSDQRKLIVREATKEDAVKLIDYIQVVGGESDFLTFGEGEFTISLEDEEKIIEQHKESENNLFIIAEIDGDVVGTLSFAGGKRVRTRHLGEFGVSVRKSYWGIGIGRHLLEYLISWAKATDLIKKINLKVRTDNHNAIHLYEKLGFKKEGLITRFFYLNQVFYDVYEMGLLIDE